MPERSRPPKTRDVKTSRARGAVSDRTNTTGGTNKGGRPTDYKPDYNEWARKFFLLKHDATDEDLAAFLEVHPASIHRWKHDHPEFCESIKEGKDRANASVAFSLYNRAVGYDITVQKVVNGELKDCKEHIPGDVQAMRLFLSNRTHWRDKQQCELTGKDGGAIKVEEMTAEDCIRLASEHGLMPEQRQ